MGSRAGRDGEKKSQGKTPEQSQPLFRKDCCGECGGYYGSKIWHSNDKYRKIVWRCNGKYERHTGCKTPTVTEEDITRLFLRALSRLRDMKDALKADCEALKTELAYTADIERERKRILEERAEVETLSANLIHENATVKMDQTVFNSRLDGYTQRYDALAERLEKLREKQTKLD